TLNLVSDPEFVALDVLVATGTGEFDLGHNVRGLIVSWSLPHREARLESVNAGIIYTTGPNARQANAGQRNRKPPPQGGREIHPIRAGDSLQPS
ncbi:MAG: hypothetical protein KJ070_07700, partial [Verrucomicrobia bacterium]|nr:hypothetical protein [Verrucomicrobiota bacterium]